MDNTQLPMAGTHAGRTVGNAVEYFVADKDVCTKQIRFAVDDGNIDYVDFGGGCDGNLTAIASMIEGMNVEFVLDRFKGITCGSKSTSCVDQLCHALEEHMKKSV